MADASRRIMIEAAGLSKYYGPFVAIKDISFSIPEGQIVSFLGPNGAGKSTTMKILAGYLAASEGTARVAGFDMTSQRLDGARQLGYLPENGPLYNDMTPLELLRFFGEARELEPARLKSRIDAVVAQCALEGVLEKPIGKLSRGYRQRVGTGAGASARSRRVNHGRAHGRARSQPDPRLSREHPRPRPHQDDPHLDAHPAGSGGRWRIASSWSTTDVWSWTDRRRPCAKAARSSRTFTALTGADARGARSGGRA
jgi:hypothetical protein